jgi:hypothetical protein
LDPDVAERLEQAIQRDGRGLKATVNEALRIGLGLAERPSEPARFKIRAFVDGLQSGIEPDKMNQLLDELNAQLRFPQVAREDFSSQSPIAEEDDVTQPVGKGART